MSGTILDDRELFYAPVSPICSFCQRHVGFSRGRCAAFDGFIPMDIWSGQNDHTQPVTGDNGMQFLALPDDYDDGVTDDDLAMLDEIMREDGDQ